MPLFYRIQITEDFFMPENRGRDGCIFGLNGLNGVNRRFVKWNCCLLYYELYYELYYYLYYALYYAVVQRLPYGVG